MPCELLFGGRERERGVVVVVVVLLSSISFEYFTQYKYFSFNTLSHCITPTLFQIYNRHALIRPKKKCDHCNGYQPKYTRVGLHVEIEYPDEMERVVGGSGDKKQFLSAQKAVDIL